MPPSFISVNHSPFHPNRRQYYSPTIIIVIVLAPTLIYPIDYTLSFSIGRAVFAFFLAAYMFLIRTASPSFLHAVYLKTVSHCSLLRLRSSGLKVLAP